MVLESGFVYNFGKNGGEVSEFRDLFRNVGLVSSMGISVALAIGIGVWFGLFLDRHLGTKPLFFWCFMLIGIASGFKNIYVITRREIGKLDSDKDK